MLMRRMQGPSRGGATVSEGLKGRTLTHDQGNNSGPPPSVSGSYSFQIRGRLKGFFYGSGNGRYIGAVRAYCGRRRYNRAVTLNDPPEDFSTRPSEVYRTFCFIALL